MSSVVTDVLRMALFSAVIVAAIALPHPRSTDAADTTVSGPYTRYSITLEKALEDLPLTFHLGQQDGLFPQAWATLPGAPKVADAVDAFGLRLSGGQVTGEIKAWVPSPTGEYLYDCRYTVDVKISGGKLSGSFDGNYAIRGNSLKFETDLMVLEPGEFRFFTHGEQLAGSVACDVQPRARGEGAVELDLNIGSVLSGGPSDKFRRVRLKLLLKDDKFQRGQMDPTYLKEPRWSGQVKQADLNITDDRVSGTVTCHVESKDLVPGTYTFTVDGKIVGNSVYGRVTSRLGDRVLELPVGACGGVIRATDGRRPDPANAVLVLTFDRAIEETHRLYVHVGRRGEGFERGAAFWKTLRHMPVDAAELKWDGRRLSGEVRVTLTPESHAIPSDRPVPVVYAVDAKVEKDGLSGSYRCTFGERLKVSGDAAGQVFSEQDLRAANAIRKGYDWPCWNGPNSNFSATPSGHKLVNDLSDARLIWKSEQTPPCRMQTTRYSEGNLKGYLKAGGSTGGGCSPVLADGRVFLYFFLPNGEDLDNGFIEQETSRGVHVLGQMWSRRADDVVLCLDAATGQTLWKTVFPGEGFYFGTHGTGAAKGAYTSNVAVASGRAYVHTTAGKTYCIDAATGQVLWSSPLGSAGQRLAVDGVLVDADRNQDLIALDAESGKLLWRIPRGGSDRAIPIKWVHSGKTCVIAGNAEGQVRCIEPRSGNVRWTIEGAGTNVYSMGVEGNFLLLNGVLSEKYKRDALGCYRISNERAQHLWTLDRDKYPYTPSHAPAAAADGHAFFRLKKPDGLAVVEIASGKVVAQVLQTLGASGYVQWTDDFVILQSDASHGPTPLNWYDVSVPSKTRQLGQTWPTVHRTTASYYPILVSHAIADGRLYIRGARGIFCYDLRRKD